MNVPLSVLDLVPIRAASTVAEALRNTIDLARAAEQAGYLRFWLTEHHLNPGVAGASPPLVIHAVAAATSSIRVGSGAVQTGHRTPLSVVEEFGMLNALFPGRIDLGLGRSGGPRSLADRGNGAVAERVVGGGDSAVVLRCGLLRSPGSGLRPRCCASPARDAAL